MPKSPFPNKFLLSMQWVEFVTPESAQAELNRLQLFVDENSIQVQVHYEEKGIDNIVAGLLMKQRHDDRVTINVFDNGGQRTIHATQITHMLHSLDLNRTRNNNIFRNRK